jgi:hypothetical protein
MCRTAPAVRRPSPPAVRAGRSRRARRALTAGLALGAWAAVAAPAASAAPSQGSFRVDVSGTQTTTWKFVKQQAPACDWPEFEDGEQTIALRTTKARRGSVKVRVGKDGALSFSKVAIEVPATATLRRTWDRRFGEITPCEAGGEPYGSGGGRNENARGEDRCRVDGTVRLRLGTTRKDLFDAGETLPAAPATDARKGAALLRGQGLWATSANPPTLPAKCEEAGQPDADMMLTAGRGEWGGDLVEARAALPIRRLLKKKHGKATVRFRATVAYPNAVDTAPGAPKTTGRTELDLKLTLRR